MSRLFRYYRPPEMIRQIGRELNSGRANRSAEKYLYLRDQLMEGEIIIALFENPVSASVAAHIGSADRLEELESLYAASLELYAVPSQELINRISTHKMEGSD